MEATHTAETLSTLLTRSVESDYPDSVLDALRRHDGERVTKRLLDDLPGGRVEWRLSRIHGWTAIQNRAFGRRETGVSLMLLRSETSQPLDVAWVERENAKYFGARRTRNQHRTAAILDTGLLSRLALTMNEIEDLRAKLTFAQGEFVRLIDSAGLDADRYTLERACGLREDK